MFKNFVHILIYFFKKINNFCNFFCNFSFFIFSNSQFVFSDEKLDCNWNPTSCVFTLLAIIQSQPLRNNLFLEKFIKFVVSAEKPITNFGFLFFDIF